MKHILFLAVFFLIFHQASSQVSNSISAAADTIAWRIAGRMKDSLDLTESQKSLIYNKNILLFHWKDSVRQLYSGNPDSLRIRTQLIENRRDTVYRDIIGEEKYQLYRQKKLNLITGQ